MANVDGSFTSTEWTKPHWMRKSDGTWRDVDTTLRKNVDGSVSPIASPYPVTLSGGGDSILARQVSNKQELVWNWTAGTLPKPKLSDSTATYAEVLPGVDLLVQVDGYGFSEVLVVKNAVAARNPALSQVKFALSGDGLSAAGLAGTAGSVNAAISENFTVGEAYMWDSARSDVPMPTSAPASDVKDATISDAGGPGNGAAQAVVPMRMDGTTLVLSPDTAMLTSPVTKFPVYIDPKSSAPVRSYWTMINSGHTTQSYWNYDRSSHAKVGNAGDGTNMYRSLFQFSTSAWKGKTVTAAEFHVDLEHSWSCSNTSTQIHVLSNATIGSGNTWSNTSSSTIWGSSLDTASNENCDDASGVDTEWQSAALTSAVNGKASAASIVVGLRAADESSAANGWKKFDETSGAGGAQLSVTYNTAPSATNLVLDGVACKTSSSPAILSTLGSPAHNPVPKLTVTDAEGDKSTVTFTYPKAGGGTTTSSVANVTSGASAQLVGGIPAANIPSGTTVYSWSVSVTDGVKASAAGPCYFRIDNTIPAPPTVTSADGVYVDDDALHGGVGKPGKFTITGTKGINKYVWGPGPANPANTVTTTDGAPVTVSYTPTVMGSNSIQVIGYNAAGTASAMGGKSFLANGPAAPTDVWALDGDGSDSASGARPLTTTGVTWTPDGRSVGASVATFNGTSSAATAATSVVTDTSFAVSAWVRPRAINGANDTAIVSQDGTDATGFTLGMRSVSGAARWSFLIKDTSAQTSTTRAAYSATALTSADVNRWVLLVGVYDISAAQLRLYVNGTLAATTTSGATPWKATGKFVVGRGMSSGVPGLWFNGDVSGVRVWDRVVYQSDVNDLGTASLAGDWTLSDAGGSDNTTRHPVTFYNGPTPAFDELNATPALGFDSALKQFGLASGPAVRTDTSYSVSAWVQPAVVSTTSANGYMTAVSQDGTQTSGLQLQFRWDIGTPDTAQWCITGRSTDVSSHSVSPPPPATPMACARILNGTTVLTPAANTWTHLVGVYDANAGALKLYINGALQATTPYTATWNAAGQVMIGGRRDTGTTGGRGDYWHGALDSVKLFNGSLTDAQITNLYQFGDAFYQNN
ncbi:LamG-like jellyroll fold domain-containing protein [Amorphoplanes digitatis]